VKVSRIIVKNSCKACQGSVAFKLDGVFSQNILPLLVSKGFNERTNFTQAGLLYVESDNLIASGRFGSDTIQTKCKKKDCTSVLDEFEGILSKLE